MDAQELHTRLPVAGSSSPTKKQAMQADAAQRAQRAWAARVAGGTWGQVAELVGYADASTACRAVRKFFGTLPDLDREETRALWRERHEVIWRQTVRDMRSGKPGATRAAVAVARSASQLDGLDQPTRIEVSDPNDQELAAFVSALAAQAGLLPSAEGDPFADEPELVPNADGVYGLPETG